MSISFEPFEVPLQVTVSTTISAQLCDRIEEYLIMQGDTEMLSDFVYDAVFAHAVKCKIKIPTDDVITNFLRRRK